MTERKRRMRAPSAIGNALPFALPVLTCYSYYLQTQLHGSTPYKDLLSLYIRGATSYGRAWSRQ